MGKPEAAYYSVVTDTGLAVDPGSLPGREIKGYQVKVKMCESLLFIEAIWSLQYSYLFILHKLSRCIYEDQRGQRRGLA